MENTALSEADSIGPQQLHGSAVSQSLSKRSFHTSSESAASSESGDNRSNVSQKVADVKVVFNDFTVAHSLITSGKAKNLSPGTRAQYRQNSSSSSEGDSRQQLFLMNKQNDKLASDLKNPANELYRSNSGKLKHAYEVDEDEDDEEFGFAQPSPGYVRSLHDASSPNASLDLSQKRTPTPLMFDKFHRDNRPPLAGGPPSGVQWPSTNPFNQRKRLGKMARPSSGILSPPDDGNLHPITQKEVYGASKYGKRLPYYSSPHGLPSPLVSKSGSGSGTSGEPRSGYYPTEGMRIDEIDVADESFDDGGLQRNDAKNYVLEPFSRFSLQLDSNTAGSGPQQSDGSTVNQFLDHYTHASNGSYYGPNDTRGAISQSRHTPASFRGLGRSRLASGVVTPSTEEEDDSDLMLNRFPKVPSPAYIRDDVSNNVGSTTYGDSRELLGNSRHQPTRLRDSPIPFLEPPRLSRQVSKGRRNRPLPIDRQVSALREDLDLDEDDSFDDVSSSVIKKPMKIQLRQRKVTSGSFQKKAPCDDYSSRDDGYDSDDGTVRHRKEEVRKSVQEIADEKENIPPSKDDSELSHYATDYRVETIKKADGTVSRKISQRKAAVHANEDEDEWSTVIEGDDASPYARIPYPMGRGNAFKQTGSSRADYSDEFSSNSPFPTSGLGPYSSHKRVMVHPAREGDQYDNHPRPFPEGYGSAYLPAKKRQGTGGFGSNTLRKAPNVLRTISNHLTSSPLGSSSPRHEYYELQKIKKNSSSPYSPQRNGKTPLRQESNFNQMSPLDEQRTLKPPASQWADGPSRDAHGVRFGKNQVPRSSDSYTQMVRAANGGEFPRFVQKQSPPQGNSTPFPPAVKSTTESIADISDTSSVDDLNGPEYDGLPGSSVQSTYYIHRNGPFETHGSSQTSTYADRKKVSQGPLAPGRFLNNIRSKVGTLRDRRQARKARRPDVEAVADPEAARSPLPTNVLRPLILKPAPCVTRPRAQHVFMFRSPKAPIVSETWGALYDQEHLDKINNVHRPAVEPPVLAHMNNNGMEMSNATSWEVIPMSPHMVAWPHNLSSLGGYAEQKDLISNIVLGVCFLLPPLLLLYATGLLDWVIKRTTKGDVEHMGRSQKRTAAWVLGAIIAAGLIAAVVVAVVRAVLTARAA